MYSVHMILTLIKPIRAYNETVRCGGKKSDSVKIQQSSCVNHLVVFEMKVWGVELLNCYNSDDQCGRFLIIVIVITKLHFLTCKLPFYICLLFIYCM